MQAYLDYTVSSGPAWTARPRFASNENVTQGLKNERGTVAQFLGELALRDSYSASCKQALEDGIKGSVYV